MKTENNTIPKVKHTKKVRTLSNLLRKDINTRKSPGSRKTLRTPTNPALSTEAEATGEAEVEAKKERTAPTRGRFKTRTSQPRRYTERPATCKF
jgi:hypothetical protein